MTKTAQNHHRNENDLTELVFLLDRSGSMGGLESDTIGGFNAMLAKQRAQEGRAFVSTVLFDHETQVLHDRLPIQTVAPLTDRDYTVRGCTALLDAIGGAVHHIGNIHKYARPGNVPARTLFVIITDGMENASRRYSGKDVKKLVERQRKRFGWEFLFIGANMDAIAAAKTCGVAADRAVNYRADRKGTAVVYEAMSEAVSNVRCGAPVGTSWSRAIEEDYQSGDR